MPLSPQALARCTAALGLCLPAPAQTPPPATQPPAVVVHSPRPPALLGRDTVFLDPAHGGDDTGAHLPDGALEKDLTLAFATRLRSQLSALGLSTLLAREDPSTSLGAASQNTPAPQPPTPDGRAGLANHLHPFACLVLHATGAGSGVHVITAALQPPSTPPDPGTPIPWDSAQLDFLPQSERLATSITEALSRAGLPATRGRAVIRPLISLTCPAVLVELAPLARSSPDDPAYQARAAQGIAATLLLFHNTADSTPSSAAAAPTQ